MPESHEKQFQGQADECHRKAPQAANYSMKKPGGGWQMIGSS
jgi:hypothetical protein